MGSKIWSAISNLGVVFNGEERDYVKKIEELEGLDRVRQHGEKECLNGFQ